MERFPLAAYYIKTSLNLAKIEQKNADLPLFRKERTVLVYKPAENQFVCVYSFGVVLFYGSVESREIGRYLKRFSKSGEDEAMIKVADSLPEEYTLIFDPNQPEAVEFDYVRLKHPVIDRLMLVFHVLAQSVAIDFLDRQVEDSMDRFERIHQKLAQKGRLIATRKEVLKTIGASGHMVNFIVGQLSLLDKPDITWEDKEAETLFSNLRKMFELDDRFGTLRFKITHVQDTSELMLDLLHTRRAEVTEIIIILLFVIDIIFIIAEKV